MTRARFFPFDYLVIGYSLAMIVLLLAVGRPLDAYLDEIVFYVAMIIVVLLIARFVDVRREPLLTMLRLGYPVLLFTFFYRMTGGTMFLLFDRFFDAQLVAFERAIFGVSPTFFIEEHLLYTGLTELFMAGYFSYYFMIPGFVLWLLIRRHYDVLRRSVTAICLTFFVSYPLFFLYPVEGPRWHFAGAYTHDITGPVFRPLVEFVIANGAVRGGCVPSTHTAVAIVIMMFCFKYYRRAGWLLLPVNICLAIGTFWGRYHYISDVVIGIVIAVVSTIVVWRYYDRWDRTPMELIRSKKVPVTHAA